MSYILEALKKLEQKRRREEGTLLLSDHHAEAVSRRQPLWIYLLVFALVLNAGLLLWWLRPWHRVEAKKGVDVIQARATVKEDAPRGPFSQARESGADKAVSQSPAPENPQKPAADEIPDRPAVPQPPRSTTGGQSPAPAAPEVRAAAPPQRPVDVSQIPLALKQGLPDLTISGHFFDTNPSARIVIIGGRTLHEGQLLAPGLRLEKITREGVILSYQGTRFRKTVF
jgi:general secretion pathway protein B